MYWDVEGISPQRAAELAQYLDRTNTGPAYMSSGSQHGGNLSQPPPAVLPSMPGGNARQQRSSQRQISSLNDYTPSVTNTSSLRSTTDPCFLELCVNTGEYKRTLNETNISHVSSDGELFELIADSYYETRAMRAFLPLPMPRFLSGLLGQGEFCWSILKPTSVLYRKVSVYSLIAFIQLDIV